MLSNGTPYRRLRNPVLTRVMSALRVRGCRVSQRQRGRPLAGFLFGESAYRQPREDTTGDHRINGRRQPFLGSCSFLVLQPGNDLCKCL